MSRKTGVRRYRRRIAPRLANGQSRLPWGHALPPEVKEGVQRIANKEGKSVSWVMEMVIIDYFGLKRPEYRTPATWKTEGTAPKEVEALYHISPSHPLRKAS